MAKGKMDFRTVILFLFLFSCFPRLRRRRSFSAFVSSIAKSLNVHISAMGSVSAVTILFTACQASFGVTLQTKVTEKDL